MIYQLNQPYLVEVSLILAIGYLIYRVLFSEDKDFIRNRIYLLTLTFISFVLPLVSLPVFAEEVMLAPVSKVVSAPTIQSPEVFNSFEWITLLPILYLSVMVLLTFRLIYHIVYISKVIGVSDRLTKDDVKYVITDKLRTPASIFSWIIVDRLDMPEEIIAHEKVHVTHGHTWDILLMEIIKIIIWFNPFVYLIAQALKNNHEYTADHLAAQSLENKLDYSSILIQYAKSSNTPILLNTFSTITKKRIIMLNKENSSNKWKSFLAIPILFAIISLFSFDTYTVPINLDSIILIDSVPEYRIDTIVTFDYDTGKETIDIERVYPNDIKTWIDTTVVFDPNTGEEKVQIVKSETPRTELLKHTYSTNEYNRRTGNMETKTYNRYPQELVQVKDTIVTFNSDTYEEQVTIIEGSRAREELISTKVTPGGQIKEGQKFDNVAQKKNKITLKKKGN